MGRGELFFELAGVELVAGRTIGYVASLAA
nr:MAG TPA: hypothetical protein [Caudoviricetes sp.]